MASPAPTSHVGPPAAADELTEGEALWSTLQERMVVVERACALVGIAMVGLLGVLTLLGMTLDVGPARDTPALALAVVVGPAAVLFAVLRELLQSRWRSGARLALVVLCAVLPWSSLAVLRFTDPLAPFVAWAPPVAFTITAFMIAVLMRPALLVLHGAVGIACYWLAWWAWAPAASEIGAAASIADARGALSRVGMIAGIAGTAAVASWALRLAAKKGASVVRERDLFGKYRLGPAIGQGGMGEVFRATYCPEGGFERQVAVKRIRPSISDEPGAIAKFRDEAALCARLLHPNIVSVLDFGRVSGRYYLAMEFVDGPSLLSLASWMRRHRLAFSSAVVAHIGRELCRGLHYAHAGAMDDSGRRLRVLHRDLSLSNVLLTQSGHVKLADFGIARALLDETLASTVEVAGKVGYMSPERARGEPHDEGVDLFALGVILWELLAGRRLFGAASAPAVLLAVQERPTPLISSVRSDVDPRWDRIIEHTTAKDPARRMTDASRLSDELAGLGSDTGIDELAKLIRACRDDDPSGFMLLEDVEATEEAAARDFAEGRGTSKETAAAAALEQAG